MKMVQYVKVRGVNPLGSFPAKTQAETLQPLPSLSMDLYLHQQPFRWALLPEKICVGKDGGAVRRFWCRRHSVSS